MKFFLLLTILLTSSLSFAAAGDRGIGALIGNPVGLSGKFWLSEDHAVDGGLALSLGEHSNLSLHSDFLLHNFSAFYLNDDIPLDFFYGLGGRMEFADEIEFGARFPLGLVHMMKDHNADVFAEIAPILDFLGRTGIELHFGVGARYYF